VEPPQLQAGDVLVIERTAGQKVPHFATQLLDDGASDADAVDDHQRGLLGAILISDQLPDVRELDPHPNDVEEVEYLSAVLVLRESELGANGEVATVLRAREVPAVNNQLVVRAFLVARQAID
jgi:hypothetical protein